MKLTLTAWLVRAVALSAAGSALLAPSLLAQPSLSINSTTVTEGNAGSVEAVLTVTLSPAAADTVTVSYEGSPANPPATGGAACGGAVDFVNPVGIVQFDPGVVSQSISVVVCGDTVDEPNEKFRVRLFNPAGATIAVSQGPVTITDDDDPGAALPTLSIDDATYDEGNVGSVTTAFNVVLSPSSDQPVTVEVAGSAGTASAGVSCSAGVDFSVPPPLPRTVTINPGTAILNVDFSLCGDTVVEPDETFTVVLRNPTNAVLGNSQGVMTIRNDDVAPPAPLTISIRDTTVAEGDLGSRAVQLTLTLSGFSAGLVTVDHAIQAGGTATTGKACGGTVDFTGRRGTVQFAATQRSRTIPVTVCGDLNAESDETFSVALSNPTGAALGDGVGQVTIQNDDIAGAVVPRDEDIVVGVASAHDLRVQIFPPGGSLGATQLATQDLSVGVTVENKGELTASSVVQITLPSDVAFERVEGLPSGTCSPIAGSPVRVECTISSLTAGASRTATVVGRVTNTALRDSTLVTFTATVDPGNAISETDETNNTDTTVVTVRAPSDLQVSGTFTKSTLIGNFDAEFFGCRDDAICTYTLVEFRLTVKNNGPMKSPRTDVLTSGAVLTDGNFTFGGLNNLCGSGRRVNSTKTGCESGREPTCYSACRIRALDPGESVLVVATGAVSQRPSGQSVTIQSRISPQVFDPISTNNTASFTLTLP